MCSSDLHTLRSSSFKLTQDTTVSELLHTHRQGPVLTEHLWKPLCISALNTPPHTASAQMFLNVMRDGLSASRADSELVISRVDLSALFPEPAVSFVKAHGGTVRLQCRVQGFTPVNGGFRVTHGEGHDDFTHLVCALPPHQVAAFIRDVLPETAAAIDALDHQPIKIGRAHV